MGQIIDFGKNVPSSFSQSISQPLLNASGTVLGQFGLNVAAGGSVLLEATFGLQNGAAASSEVIFSFVRNAVEIFSIRSSSNTSNSLDSVSFSFMDSNLPAAYYAYGLTAWAVSANNRPVVVGPLIFSGVSMVL
ncbi:hypothetical protein [Paenibacillus sp. NFR01]|uniref:hypothetical protein n=1 Tax=Paenibacillus sp. NFR01 TaxID=1566279 RepID=UPI000B87BC03|nr:hypothetical protein [Paenibacillus sp. NFR01]